MSRNPCPDTDLDALRETMRHMRAGTPLKVVRTGPEIDDARIAVLPTGVSA